VAAGYSCLHSHVRKGHVAVVVKEMVGLSGVRVGDKDVFESVIVIIADADRSAAGSKHVKDIGILSVKHPRVVLDADAGLGGELFKANGAGAEGGGDGRAKTLQETAQGGIQFGEFSHSSLRSVSTRLLGSKPASMVALSWSPSCSRRAFKAGLSGNFFNPCFQV